MGLANVLYRTAELIQTSFTDSVIFRLAVLLLAFLIGRKAIEHWSVAENIKTRKLRQFRTTLV